MADNSTILDDFFIDEPIEKALTGDSVSRYFEFIRTIKHKIGWANHALLCRKCKSNNWHKLKKTNPLTLKATCANCNSVQYLTKQEEQYFIEEVI